MLDLWGSQASAIIRRNYSQAKIQSEARRMEDARKRLDMLDDDWKEELLDKLRQRYKSPRIQAELEDIASIEHNVFKRLVDELSQVYARPAIRRIEGDPEQDRIAQALWAESDIDSVMLEADRYLTAMRDIIIVPEIVDGIRLRYRVITPDRFTVIQHPQDPGDMTGFTYERTLANTAGYADVEIVHADVQAWTIDSTNKANSRIWEHGIGRVPAVYVHADARVQDDFFSPTRFGDVYEANLSIGVDLTMLTRLMKWQSELQVTYKGKPKELAKSLHMGADGLWAAPGDFNRLDLQADPEKLMRTIRMKIGLISAQVGLSADMYDLSMSPSSGFQIRLKRLPIENQRKRRVPTWRRKERELFIVTALVCEREHRTLKPSSIANFQIDHTDEAMLEDPKTETDLFDRWIAQGRMAPEEPLQRDNPDLNALDAAKKQRENLIKYAQLNEFIASRNIAKSGGAFVSKSAQENGMDGAQARGRNGQIPKEWIAKIKAELREEGSL